MKKLLLSTFVLALGFNTFSQVTIYSENFESGGTPFSLNATDLGGAIVENIWLVNNVYSGGSGTLICLGFPFSYTVPSMPNQPAGITNSPNSTYMHVTAQFAVTGGITCGSYGAADGLCILDESNFSKMSAPISTVGYTNVSLDFWWICGGAAEAFGEVYYSLDGGSSWTLKNTGYNNALTWVQASTLTDPAWDNAASLLIGFNFDNTTAATASDPGFSVDDIVITGMAPSNTITTTDDFTPANWCQGSTVTGTVNFVSTGVFNPGNIYSAEMSDPTGSFATPMTIGTLASSASGSLSISVAVAGATPAGAGYRVRVLASDPAIVGTDNTSDIAIYALPTVTQTTFSDVCIDNGAVALSGGSPTGGTYSGTGVSGSNFDPSSAGAGTHGITYYYVDANGCDGSAVETIVVNGLPTVSLGAFTNVCVDEAAFALSGGSPIGGTYSGTGVSGGMFDPATGTGTYTITYSYTDANNCSAMDSQTILVDGCLSLSENASSGIVIYPNPAQTSFSLDAQSSVDAVVIMDMNGRIVKSFVNQTAYDISNLNEGMYMVRISIGGSLFVKRLVIR